MLLWQLLQYCVPYVLVCSCQQRLAEMPIPAATTVNAVLDNFSMPPQRGVPADQHHADTSRALTQNNAELRAARVKEHGYIDAVRSNAILNGAGDVLAGGQRTQALYWRLDLDRFRASQHGQAFQHQMAQQPPALDGQDQTAQQPPARDGQDQLAQRAQQPPAHDGRVPRDRGQVRPKAPPPLLNGGRQSPPSDIYQYLTRRDQSRLDL